MWVAQARDRLQPVEGALEEGERRHHVAGGAVVQRLQQPLDQPVVVEIRQPGHADALGRVLAATAQVAAMVHHVPVADHDPFGARRRTRGVLEIGQVVRLDPGLSPGVRGVAGDRADVEMRDRLEPGDVARTGHEFQDRGIGDHDGDPGIPGDRPEPRQGPLEPAGLRRRRRDGDHARIEAAEERLEEVQPGREQQERPIPRRPGRLEPRRDPPRRPIQLAVRQPFAFPAAVVQERIGQALGPIAGPSAQQFHQRGARIGPRGPVPATPLDGLPIQVQDTHVVQRPRRVDASSRRRPLPGLQFLEVDLQFDRRPHERPVTHVVIRRVVEDNLPASQDRREHHLHLQGRQHRAQALTIAAPKGEVLVRAESPLEEAARAEGQRIGVQLFPAMHQVGAGCDVDPSVGRVASDLHRHGQPPPRDRRQELDRGMRGRFLAGRRQVGTSRSCSVSGSPPKGSSSSRRANCASPATCEARASSHVRAKATRTQQP